MFYEPIRKIGNSEFGIGETMWCAYKIENETGHILEKIRTFIRHSHSILFYVGQWR